MRGLARGSSVIHMSRPGNRPAYRTNVGFTSKPHTHTSPTLLRFMLHSLAQLSRFGLSTVAPYSALAPKLRPCGHLLKATKLYSMTSNSGSRLNAAGQPDRELPGGEPENFSDRWEREW